MDVIGEMRALGFSQYEATAYVGLLKNYPLSGYALSKVSGIPRSRIYEVLGNLVKKQVVLEESREKTPLYYPVDPKMVTARLQRDYARIFKGFSTRAGALYAREAENRQLVVVQGRREIIDLLRLLIGGAKSRIALSVWRQELDEIREEVDKALDRGVVLRGICLGGESPYGDLHPHRRMDRYVEAKKQRFMAAIIDGSHTLSGILSRGAESKVSWSRDEGFTEVFEDYIVHDLVVNMYSAALNEEDRGAHGRYEDFSDQVHEYYFNHGRKPKLSIPGN